MPMKISETEQAPRTFFGI